MGITYRDVRESDYSEVKRLLIAVGWGQRISDDERFARMIRGANRCLVACDSNDVVGFGRALFDGASNGYISTVAVAPDRRGQGIGRELVRRLMECENPRQITWVLRSRVESRGFWERMGFKASEVAMEIARSE